MRILRKSARLLRRVMGSRNTLSIRTKPIDRQTVGARPKKASPGNATGSTGTADAVAPKATKRLLGKAPTEKTIRLGTRGAPSRDGKTSPVRTRATYRLPHSILLNAVPKSGTVLMERIIRSFIAPEDWVVAPWVRVGTIAQLRNVSKKSIVGHLHLTPESYEWARDKRHILLLRDPLEHCVSYARFMCSRELAEDDRVAGFIRDQVASPSFALRMVVQGCQENGMNHPPAVHYQYPRITAWAGLGVHVIFFKDVLKAVKTMNEPYWRELISFAGVPFTDDWRTRISEAATPEESTTWSGGIEYSVNTDGFPSEEDMAYLRATCGDLQQQYQELWEQFRSPAARALDARDSEPPVERAA